MPKKLTDKIGVVVGAAVAAVALYAYQKAWITDEARFKLIVKARQIGITFATTLRHVRRRLRLKGTTLWISASERQSREAIEYVKLHLQALNEAFEYDEIEFPGYDGKALQVTLKHNGARIIAMPANPDTVRGFSGDVVLDEFAFHRDAMKIWRAALAIVSRGYSLEVISTPNGQQGKYWDIAKECGVPPLGGSGRTHWLHGVWSVHWIDIHTAAAQGCPIDIAELHSAAGDEDSWLQEEECVFLADAENFIPLDLIISAESELASLEVPPDFQPRGDLFLGYDVGRRKDAGALCLIEKLADVAVVRALQRMVRQTFAAQEAAIDLLMPTVRRGCVDTTGMGMQMGENLTRRWGAKIEAVEFNLLNKEQMATRTKREFEERRLRIPSAPFIRRSINAVKRYASPTGHFRFDAERTEQGHADEFWALALAISASAGAPAAVMATINPTPEWAERNRRGVMSETARAFLGNQPEPELVRDRSSVWAR